MHINRHELFIIGGAVSRARADLAELDRPGIAEHRREDREDVFGENHVTVDAATHLQMTVADLRVLLDIAERYTGGRV